MNRENILAIRLTEAERQVIETLAKVEKLPASTLVRRRLLLEAENRGISPRQVEPTKELAFA
jgi:hypothetical protein